MDDIGTVAVGRRTALGGMLLVEARLVSRVFDFATMLALGRILEPKDFGLVTIGMVSPALAVYQKKMSFWRDCSVEFIGKVVAFVVSISLALLTASYWSIAIGTVSFTVAMAVISYWFASYRPRLSLSELHLFSGFVGWVGAAQLISAINWQFERLLLGKLKSSSELGLFSTASDIAGAVLYGFAEVIAARLVSEIVANMVSMLAVRRMIGLTLRDQVFESWRSLVSVAAMAGGVRWLTEQLGASSNPAQTVMDLAAVVVAGATLYAAILLTLWIASGRPPGVEATAIGMARDILAMRRPITSGAGLSN